MSEYIEKQAAIDELCNVDEYNTRSIAAIKDMKPAADVRPVRRGRWVVFDDLGSENIKCSACGEAPYWHPTDYAVRPGFCPNCGADMREEAEE